MYDPQSFGEKCAIAYQQTNSILDQIFGKEGSLERAAMFPIIFKKVLEKLTKK